MTHHDRVEGYTAAMPPLPKHFLELLKRYKVAVVYYTAILITVIVLRLYGVI